MLESVTTLPAADARQMRVMEEAAGWGADPKGLRDKWTS
jgi:hypothetical protein